MAAQVNGGGNPPARPGVTTFEQEGTIERTMSDPTPKRRRTGRTQADEYAAQTMERIKATGWQGPGAGATPGASWYGPWRAGGGLGVGLAWGPSADAGISRGDADGASGAGAAERSGRGGPGAVGSCACGSCGVCHVHQEEVGVGGAGTRHAGSHMRREEAGSGGGADAMGSEGGARTMVAGVGSGEAGVVATQPCSSSS